MAFFNMNTGDAPIFKKLADNYTLPDNFHQAIMVDRSRARLESRTATTLSTATATAIRGSRWAPS
jgi:phospholipase C